MITQTILAFRVYSLMSWAHSHVRLVPKAEAANPNAACAQALYSQSIGDDLLSLLKLPNGSIALEIRRLLEFPCARPHDRLSTSVPNRMSDQTYPKVPPWLEIQGG